MSMRSTRFTSQPHTVRQFLYFDLMRLISFLVLFTHSHHAGGPTTRCTWLIRCKTAGASALVAGRPTISEHISHPTACVPDDATLVQSAVELHDDLAGAPVVDELEVADVSGLLHAQEELDKHLRSGESPATVVLIMPRSAREREDKVRPVQSTKKTASHRTDRTREASAAPRTPTPTASPFSSVHSNATARHIHCGRPTPTTHLAARPEEDLPLSSLLRIGERLEAVRENGDAHHRLCVSFSLSLSLCVLLTLLAARARSPSPAPRALSASAPAPISIILVPTHRQLHMHFSITASPALYHYYIYSITNRNQSGFRHSSMGHCIDDGLLYIINHPFLQII